MDLNVIFTFIRDNGHGLGEAVENDALNNRDREALISVRTALEQIREDDIQNMTERGVDRHDFPDEQIGVEGYSIDELIDHVNEMIENAAAQPIGATSAEGGKRKSRRQRKSRKSRKSHKLRKQRKSRKMSRKTRSRRHR